MILYKYPKRADAGLGPPSASSWFVGYKFLFQHFGGSQTLSRRLFIPAPLSHALNERYKALVFGWAGEAGGPLLPCNTSPYSGASRVSIPVQARLICATQHKWDRNSKAKR